MVRKYKGKGVTTHVLTDFNRHPLAALSKAAHIDELKQVLHLLKALGSWKPEGAILEADKGYTSKRLREQISS